MEPFIQTFLFYPFPPQFRGPDSKPLPLLVPLLRMLLSFAQRWQQSAVKAGTMGCLGSGSQIFVPALP